MERLPEENQAVHGLRKFTERQLRRFCGRNGAPIYVAIKGVVYDVTRYARLYGPGCDYELFAGRECARALALLQLSPDMLNNEIDDLDETTEGTLSEFIRKFRRQYPAVGLVRKQSFISRGSWYQIAVGLMVATICVLKK